MHEKNVCALMHAFMRACIHGVGVRGWESVCVRERERESYKNKWGGLLVRIEERLRDLEPCSALLVYEALSN
jgi:hypothetical protein